MQNNNKNKNFSSRSKTQKRPTQFQVDIVSASCKKVVNAVLCTQYPVHYTEPIFLHHSLSSTSTVLLAVAIFRNYLRERAVRCGKSHRLHTYCTPFRRFEHVSGRKVVRRLSTGAPWRSATSSQNTKTTLIKSKLKDRGLYGCKYIHGGSILVTTLFGWLAVTRHNIAL